MLTEVRDEAVRDLLIIHFQAHKNDTTRCFAGLCDSQWSTGAAWLCARCCCACPCACVMRPARRHTQKKGREGVRRVAGRAGSAAHLAMRRIQLIPVLELIRGVSCAARGWQSRRLRRRWIARSGSCGPLPRRRCGAPARFRQLAFGAGRRLVGLQHHCGGAHAH